jgi:hypothetical protein
MKMRKHHNNHGLTQIKRGKTERTVRNIAKKLGIPYGKSNQPAYEAGVKKGEAR